MQARSALGLARYSSVATEERQCRNARAAISGGLLILLVAVCGPVAAQPLVWVGHGPGPNTQGQVENIIPDDEVVGAINAVAPHPANANIVYVGAVNGGIWKTTNAMAGSPTWERNCGSLAPADSPRYTNATGLQQRSTDSTSRASRRSSRAAGRPGGGGPPYRRSR